MTMTTAKVYDARITLAADTWTLVVPKINGTLHGATRPPQGGFTIQPDGTDTRWRQRIGDAEPDDGWPLLDGEFLEPINPHSGEIWLWSETGGDAWISF